MAIIYNAKSTKQHMKTKLHLHMEIAGVEQDLSDKIMTAKMIQEKSFLPDSVPISTLEVTIADPDGVYNVIKSGGKTEIADVDQLALLYIDMEPQYFVTDSNGKSEWVTGETKTYFAGEWYFNKSEYKSNALKLVFYDWAGVDSKTAMSYSAPIFFYDYKTEEIVSSGTVPYDAGITERDRVKYQLMPYPVSDNEHYERCTQTKHGLPLTQAPNIELKQKTTSVTIKSRRFNAQYNQDNIRSHQQWAKSLNYSTGDGYNKNDHLALNGRLKDGYYEETLNISKQSMYSYVLPDGITRCYWADLKLAGTYLPYTYKIFAIREGSIVASLPYLTSRMRPDTVTVQYFGNADPGLDVEDFDSIKIRAVPTDVLVNEYHEPGTYTKEFKDKFINDSVEVFTDYWIYKKGVTITKKTQHSITYEVTEACDVIIGQQALIEEQVEATATAAGSENLARKDIVISNPSLGYGVTKVNLQNHASKCLQTVNEYPYQAKIKLYPQVKDENVYNTPLGNFSPEIGLEYANYFGDKGEYAPDPITGLDTLYCVMPGTILGYRPAADVKNRSFKIWIERIETDLTGGCIRTISGVAKANN